MATFDDMALERKVTVYDKGFDERVGSYGEYITRSGDIWSPQISNEEPLRIECQHFVECVRDGRARRARTAPAALRVVRVLEALQRSLDGDGRRLSAGRLRARVMTRLAPGLCSATTSSSARTSSFGADVVIHSGTVIGDGCVIQDGAVLGKRAAAGAHVDGARAPEPEPLVLGAGVDGVRRARSSTRARASASGAIVGDQAQVRERAAIGAGRVIGRGCGGRQRRRRSAPRVRIQSHCYLTAYIVVEDDVFVGPGVVTTNDDTMGRHARGPRAARRRAAARAAGSAAAPCSCPASRSARRRSSPPARS